MRAGFRRTHQQQRETPRRALLQPSTEVKAGMHRAARTAALHVSETLSSEQHACVNWRCAVVMVSRNTLMLRAVA